jgi:hypothetical protein
LERFAGFYRLSSREFVCIQPWPGGGGKLAYSDEAGQVRALFPVAKNVFSAGPGFLLQTPTEATLTFVRNSKGKITRLIRRRNGLPDRTAERLDSYKREPVSFRNGEVKLAGVFLRPPGKGPYPAIVLIHGSGETDRNSVLPIAQFLVRHGVALLGYDKRGVGDSTGAWRTASLEELAGDAIAAVQFLRGRKDIDPKRIGVFAVSQGGWVAPLAASESGDIAFLISVSGPGVTPAEVELGRLEHALRARDFPETAVGDALALVKLRDEVTQGRRRWEDFQAAVEKARGAAWLRYTPAPPSADSWLFEHWRRLPLDYAPGPVLEKLRVPVLALFGGLDHTVLADENAGQWRAALARGGHKDYTIKIFPTGNHMLLEARTGAEDEYPALKRFVPEVAPLVLDWLRARGIGSSSR